MREKSKKLLAVLAHPDDESFGLGGTLAMYARQGVEVSLICATRGEAGEVAPSFMQKVASISELREQELACAAHNLGISAVYYLPYRDSGMRGSKDNDHPQALAAQPLEDVAKKIALYIRQLQPQVILTFDPSGGYFHPDHIQVHLATVRAFELAADSQIEMGGLPAHKAQKLYYHIMPKGLIKLAILAQRLIGKDPSRMGQNHDIDLLAIAKAVYPVHARIRYTPVVKQVEKAWACHASQGGGKVMGNLATGLIRRITAVDSYMQAIPEKTVSGIDRDLFTGVQIM